MSNLTQRRLFRSMEGEPLEDVLEDKIKSQEILITASELSLKRHTL